MTLPFYAPCIAGFDDGGLINQIINAPVQHILFYIPYIVYIVFVLMQVLPDHWSPPDPPRPSGSSSCPHLSPGLPSADGGDINT